MAIIIGRSKGTGKARENSGGGLTLSWCRAKRPLKSGMEHSSREFDVSLFSTEHRNANMHKGKTSGIKRCCPWDEQ